MRTLAFITAVGVRTGHHRNQLATNSVTCRRRLITNLSQPASTKSDENESNNEKDENSNSNPSPKTRQRRLSAESRAKISAALKGRPKSEQHRENLRRRFGGDQNPMYGRKLSAETRAKISRAMVARHKDKNTKKKKRNLSGSSSSKSTTTPPVSEETMNLLREKAQNSRLFQSQENETGDGQRRRSYRNESDENEENELERLLQTVARLDKPPEAVVKTRAAVGRRRYLKDGEERNDERELECVECNGSGMVNCEECVARFGVASSRCQVCYGVGSVFCEICQGVGYLMNDESID